MATHVFDDIFDATIRPADKLRPGSYSVQVNVGYRTGELTGASFTGEGTTAKRAEAAALEKARNAIAEGKIENQGIIVVSKRTPLAVLADFQAFERFRVMNQNRNATVWSRSRENKLRSKLTDELGDVFKILQMIYLLVTRHEDRESPSLTAITAALEKSNGGD